MRSQRLIAFLLAIVCTMFAASAVEAKEKQYVEPTGASISVVPATPGDFGGASGSPSRVRVTKARANDGNLRVEKTGVKVSSLQPSDFPNSSTSPVNRTCPGQLTLAKTRLRVYVACYTKAQLRRSSQKWGVGEKFESGK